MSKYVCDRCKDTHLMLLDGRKVGCTSCPTPCSACRQRERAVMARAFCEETPCTCECHKEVELDRGARRKDTDHPQGSVTSKDYSVVWGETRQEAKEEARDRLLIALARAVPMTNLARDEVLRAARELEDML